MNNPVTTRGNGQHNEAIPREETRRSVFTPRVDIWENSEELVLFADMPGVKPEDLDLHFENGELRLHGKCAPQERTANAVTAEYEVGDFYRVFTVHEDIDSDRIAAELKHGVLAVHLPKSEKVKPKKISVNAG